MRPDFEAAWRRRFETFGLEHEDDAGIAGWSEAGLQARFRNFARSWRPAAAGGALWLDAGCGAGTYARMMTSSGQRVLALDYSLPSLQKARRRSPGDDLLWVAGDATMLPLQTGSCDGAICFGVLQSLSDPTRAVSELVRVVRPGGEVWVDALNSRCLPNLLWRLLDRARGKESKLRYDAPRTLRRVMQEGGLRDIRVTWIPILPHRLRRLQPLLESKIGRGLLNTLPWMASVLSHAYVLAARR